MMQDWNWLWVVYLFWLGVFLYIGGIWAGYVPEPKFFPSRRRRKGEWITATDENILMYGLWIDTRLSYSEFMKFVEEQRKRDIVVKVWVPARDDSRWSRWKSIKIIRVPNMGVWCWKDHAGWGRGQSRLWIKTLYYALRDL